MNDNENRQKDILSLFEKTKTCYMIKQALFCCLFIKTRTVLINSTVGVVKEKVKQGFTWTLYLLDPRYHYGTYHSVPTLEYFLWLCFVWSLLLFIWFNMNIL